MTRLIVTISTGIPYLLVSNIALPARSDVERLRLPKRPQYATSNVLGHVLLEWLGELLAVDY